MAGNGPVNPAAPTNDSADVSDTEGLINYAADIAILVSILLAIIFANTLVFVLFKFAKELRTPANYVLLSLAVSDFLTGFVNIPLFIIVNFTPIVQPHLMAPMITTRMVFHNVTAISGIYHTLVITVERFRAITRPLSHRSGSNLRKMVKVIASVWFAAAVLGVIPIAWFHIWQDPLGERLTVGYISLCLIAVFGAPYIFMAYAHIVMYRAISRRGFGARAFSAGGSNGGRRRLRDDKKTITTFALMAVVFFICWFPWFLLQLIATLGKPDVSEVVYQVFLIMRYMSAVINPLLYTFLKWDFQQAVRRLFCGRQPARRHRGTASIQEGRTLSTRYRETLKDNSAL